MSQKILTIAIPTFNGAGTIRDVLDTIVAQTDDRFEVMVINNCSTDNTVEVVNSYANRIKNLKVISQERNVGPDANFLDCFRKAEGRYVHLMSDDDIYIEGAIGKILDVLSQHDDIGLVYLQTVGFYGRYTGKDSCDQKEWNAQLDTFVTTDKVKFMEAAHHYWGFLSSFICSTKNFASMPNPENYFKTNWLQSYIHAYCAKGDDTKLAVISGPCIGAGRYINVSNFDCSRVDGICYKNMVDYSVDVCGFDKKQMTYYWKKRLFMLTSHEIIKEKAIGIKKISYSNLFKITWRMPEAWIKVYPYMLVPKFVCRAYNSWYRKKMGITKDGGLNRDD